MVENAEPNAVVQHISLLFYIQPQLPALPSIQPRHAQAHIPSDVFHTERAHT